MFLLVLVVLVMFFNVLGSSQTLVLKRYISVIGMYEKRGTSLFLLDSSHNHILFIYSIDERVFNIVFLLYITNPMQIHAGKQVSKQLSITVHD